MMMTLISHGDHGLQVATDEGHRLHFQVIVDGEGRRLEIDDVAWTPGRQPFDDQHVVRHATAFAAVCAQDVGLI